jgi:undecaprenyl-diphosphatase
MSTESRSRVTILHAGALTATLAFLLLARWVQSGASMPFDLAIRGAVHAWATPPATHVLFAITMLGSGWVMIPLAALVVWFVPGGRRFAISVLIAELASDLLKVAFYRPRPTVFFGLPPADTYSFPSGHAFVATVCYGMLAELLMARYPAHRRGIAAIAVLVALTIGFSRVYLGYHYPTDVLGGWLCAIAWLALSGAPHRAHQSSEHGH